MANSNNVRKALKNLLWLQREHSLILTIFHVYSNIVVQKNLEIQR